MLRAELHNQKLLYFYSVTSVRLLNSFSFLTFSALTTQFDIYIFIIFGGSI